MYLGGKPANLDDFGNEYKCLDLEVLRGELQIVKQFETVRLIFKKITTFFKKKKDYKFLQNKIIYEINLNIVLFL